MMCPDPMGRISAREALRHPWLLGQTVYKELPISDTNIIKNMRKFNSSRKLKQVALNVIASALTRSEIESELRDIFKRLDANGDGIVTVDELKMAIAELDVDKKTLDEFSDAIDLSHTGTVDYEEFLAASMKQSDYLQDNILHDAFHFFDRDNDGFISPDELKVVIKKLLKHEPTEKEIKDLIDDADLDHDGKIAYKEFEAMMRDGNSTITKKILVNTSASNLGSGSTAPSSGNAQA
jgi:calcium-dependent protein kinase